MKKNIINTALLALTFGIFSQGTLHAMEEDSELQLARRLRAFQRLNELLNINEEIPEPTEDLTVLGQPVKELEHTSYNYNLNQIRHTHLLAYDATSISQKIKNLKIATTITVAGATLGTIYVVGSTFFPTTSNIALSKFGLSPFGKLSLTNAVLVYGTTYLCFYLTKMAAVSMEKIEKIMYHSNRIIDPLAVSHTDITIRPSLALLNTRNQSHDDGLVWLLKDRKHTNRPKNPDDCTSNDIYACLYDINHRLQLPKLTLPCGHSFHPKCLQFMVSSFSNEWKEKCPLCH